MDIDKFFGMERFSSSSYGAPYQDKGKSGAPGQAFFDMHIVDAHQSLVNLANRFSQVFDFPSNSK